MARETAWPYTNAIRVGLVTWDYPVVSETFVTGLAAGLSGAGCDVRLLVVSSETDPPATDQLEPLVRRAALQPAMALAEVRALAKRSLRAALFGLLDTVMLRTSTRMRVARMMMREEPFDIVHCQFATIGRLALRHRRLGTLRARRLVVHLRGYDISSVVAAEGPSAYATLFRQADLFIANCQFFRQRAISLGCAPEKVVVIGSPIDTETFQPLPRPERPATARLRLVAIGRLVEKKGFSDAIEALAILRERGVDADLRIVGDGPLRAALERQAAALGLSEHVRFDGAQPRSGVIAALAESDIALGPSIRAADGNEDAPLNTLKEAMAMGLPVVATRHGGIPELVVDGENGRLVAEHSPHELAAALADLAANPASWTALGSAGRARVVGDYDTAGVIRRTLDAYTSLLEQDDPA